MFLNPHIQQLGTISPQLDQILRSAVQSVDLDDPNSLTKEEAFFDSCNRFDAETEFFHVEKNFYSGVVPRSELTDKLQPYFAYLVENHFPQHTIFRAQVVRNIPGRVVRPHIDPRLYHKLSHRVHAVLETNSRCGHVYFEPEKGYEMDVLFMEKGLLYDFDNITPHAAFNLGTSDRLHIIVDMIPDHELQDKKEVFLNDPNHMEEGVFQAYYKHVKAITAVYGPVDQLHLEYGRRV